MIDWSRATLVDTADAIAAGTVRAREVMEACLDRASHVAEHLACFVDLDRDKALAAADAADAAQRSGQPLGPLHGVPLAHKDMYYRPGEISQCGSRLRDAPQTAQSTVLSRFDAAGAVEMGRLVMVEFAMGPHGYNANYQVCRNAWNPDYIPCGSSSGSGVAVAARLVHGSMGSDTGGSIRCPASVAGVVGLLPTYGRVSRHGTMPMSFSLDSLGPLARTARDCARMMSVIAGPDPRDGTSLDAPVPDYEAFLDEVASPPRIGLARGYFDDGLHPEVNAAVEAAADTLVRIGMKVEIVDVPSDLLSEAAELHPLVMKAEGAANHMADMREAMDQYTPEVGRRLQAGYFIPATAYLRALKLRAAYLRAFGASVFSKVDLLLTPTLGIPVPRIEETMSKQGKDYLDMVVSLTRNTKIANYLGLPAISVPCGFTSNGLPTSFQLIGRPLSEPQLLKVCHAYQTATDWHLQEPKWKPNRASANSSPGSN